MGGSRGRGPNCCCGGSASTGYCTTRFYDSGGSQKWVADFGIDTNDGCLDSTDNAIVVGPRALDMTILNTRNGGSGVNAIQTIYGVKCDAGSQFRVSLDGYRTGLLDWNCTASDLQTALEALGNIGTGNVSVSGSSLGPTSNLPITFQGALAGTAVNFMSLETFKLLGLPTVKEYRASDGALLASGYTESTPNRIRYVNGYAYVACNRSAGLQLVSITASTVYRLQAFGELSGGTFRLYRSSIMRLEATGDLNYNASASDVQTALRAFTAYGTNVACTGGPLPFVPITITFTLDATNNFNGASLDIEQGNLTGGLNFYKFDPADLSQVWAVNAGFSNCNAVATDSSGKVYVGGRSSGAFQETTPKGENKTDSFTDDSDVFLRQYDNSGSSQSLGIKTYSAAPSPCVVDSSGNVFTSSSPWRKVYKLYLTGTVTGGTFQVAYNGSPLVDSFGHPLDFAYNIRNSDPGLPFGTGVADLLGEGGLNFTCIGDWNLTVSPIWLFSNSANPALDHTLTIYASSLTGGGSVSLDIVNAGDYSIATGAISKFNSSGARTATATFISSNIGGNRSGLAYALDSSQHLCVSPWDSDNSSVLTLLSNDLGTIIWRAVISGHTDSDLPQTYACGFDSSSNVYQAGTRGNTAKSTRKFDSSTPPSILWQKDHGLGLTATMGNGQDPSVLGLGVTSVDGVMTTGVRVKLTDYPG